MQNTTHGFTVIELISVIALMTILVGFAVLGFQNFATYQRFEQAVSDVRATLSDIRVAARATESNEQHGIHIATSTLTRFYGSSYVSTDPQNEVSTYQDVTFSTALSDGGQVIMFEPLTGRPSATGTITVAGTRFSSTVLIEVLATGVIQ